MDAPRGAPRERLTYLLDQLQPGDEIHVIAASRESGMDESTCATVFAALARVGLFIQTSDGVFTRCRLFDALERLAV